MRKQVLLAHSSLYRLQIANEIAAVRESTRWQRIGIALAASPAARSALFGLLVLATRRSRVGRVLRGAAIALALAKVAHSAATRFQR